MMNIPIIIARIIRRMYRAKAESMEDLASAVQNDLEGYPSGIYSDVGSDPGSIILGYTPDTTGLDIEEWSGGTLYNTGANTIKQGPARVLRQDSAYKVPQQTRNMIESSYQGLNSYMIRCIPNEYPDGFPRAIVRDINTGHSLTAHDFRFAGDTSTVMAIGRMKNKYLKILKDRLEYLINFVEYITPLRGKTKISYSPVDVTIEGYKFTVDEKGNKIVPNDNIVETKVLS